MQSTSKSYVHVFFKVTFQGKPVLVLLLPYYLNSCTVIVLTVCLPLQVLDIIKAREGNL